MAKITTRKSEEDNTLHCDSMPVNKTAGDGETTICKRTGGKFDASQVWEKDYLPDGIYVIHQYVSTEKVRDSTEKELEDFRDGIWKSKFDSTLTQPVNP